MLEKILAVLERIRDALQGPFFLTPYESVIGIGTGAAYAANDAFGLHFKFRVPKVGRIDQLNFQDVADQGIAKYLMLFAEAPALQTDNGVLDVADSDALTCVGWIALEAADFLDMGSSRIGQVRKIGLIYEAPGRILWGQFRTEGADNIAAGSIPRVQLTGRRG